MICPRSREAAKKVEFPDEQRDGDGQVHSR
jgi:hypothetical protein